MTCASLSAKLALRVARGVGRGGGAGVGCVAVLAAFGGPWERHGGPRREAAAAGYRI